jgi:hypothetical protein
VSNLHCHFHEYTESTPASRDQHVDSIGLVVSLVEALLAVFDFPAIVCFVPVEAVRRPAETLESALQINATRG